MRPVLYFDGACLPRNPGGVATFGWVLEWDGKKEKGEGVETENGTNNIAEYAGLIAGLEKALEKGIEEIVVRGDSQLVIYQLEGIYRVKSPRLLPYYRRARDLLIKKFKRAFLEWIPREENSEADELSTMAYVKYEFLREWRKRDTIREWKKTEEGLYEVNGYTVRLESLKSFSCTCPSFEKKNSAQLLKRSGIVVPCKHVAFVYFTLK